MVKEIKFKTRLKKLNLASHIINVPESYVALSTAALNSQSFGFCPLSLDSKRPHILYFVIICGVVNSNDTYPGIPLSTK